MECLIKLQYNPLYRSLHEKGDFSDFNNFTYSYITTSFVDRVKFYFLTRCHAFQTPDFYILIMSLNKLS